MRRVLAVRGVLHHPDSVDRERLLRAELAAVGLELPPEQVITGDFSREASYRAVLAALRSDPRHDALVCFNDQSAIGALDAVHDAGLRAPRDLVVTGFDDDEFAALVRPSLTTVDQDLAGQGARAARLLLDMIDGAPAQSVRHPVTLLRRGSTARRTADAAADVPVADTGDTTDESADRSWRYVWNAMISMDTMLEISRTLLTCGSQRELIGVLGQELRRLQARRAFLVLGPDDADPDGGGDPDGAADGPRGMLRFAFHDDAVQDVSGEQPFALADLLPAHRSEHLRDGWCTLQPIGAVDRELGYLLLEQVCGAGVMVSGSLGVDLGRSLAAIRSARRLARHAEELETLVVRRTAQLEAELATRRAAETRLSQANAHLQSEVVQRKTAEAQLRRVNRELHALASVDGLTGVANRGVFDEVLSLQVSACNRSASPLSLIMIDVDRFKAYNDAYGHLAGDDALRVVADCLRVAVGRPNDLAARYGGEEFVVVLPSTAAEGAVTIAGRIAAGLASRAVPHRGSELGVLTVSMGIATVHPTRQTRPEHLIQLADQRLYRAKREGRNGIVTGDGPVSQGDDPVGPVSQGDGPVSQGDGPVSQDDPAEASAAPAPVPAPVVPAARRPGRRDAPPAPAPGCS